MDEQARIQRDTRTPTEMTVSLYQDELATIRAERDALLAAHAALVERARVLQEVAIDSLLDINYVRSVQPNIYLDRVADALAELATAAPQPAASPAATGMKEGTE